MQFFGGQNRWAGFTLIEMLIVVIIMTVLATIALPQFINAQDRAKQGQTIGNIRTAATAIMLFQTDNGANPGGTMSGYLDDITSILVPNYVPFLNSMDGWEHEIEYRTDGSVVATGDGVTIGTEPNSFVLRSPGKDGVYEGSQYNIGQTSLFSHDIVMINGMFVRTPTGTQGQG